MVEGLIGVGVVATPLTFNSVSVPEGVERNSTATLLAMPSDPALPAPRGVDPLPCRTNANPEVDGPLNCTLKFVEKGEMAYSWVVKALRDSLVPPSVSWSWLA